jgi:protein-tyrosine phosphatase
LIDLHSHVLPGVDDGAETLDASVEMLRAAAADGIVQLAATPHVRDDHPTEAGTMERRVAEVNAAAQAAGVDIEVLPGGELDIRYLERLDDETLRRFGLGGNPELLLLEFPYVGLPLGLRDLVFRLGVRGFRVVLAHPERNADVQAYPQVLRELVDAGVVVQITAASLDGRIGRRSREAALALVDAGLAHLVASDAHAPDVRAIGLAAAVEALDDDALARWLTLDVPEALVSGRPLPERPERSGHRSNRRLRLPWRN